MQSAAPVDRPFEPFTPDAKQPFDDRWAGHLLRRAGFGATHALLDRFSGKLPGAALDWLFDYDPAHDPLDTAIESLAGFAYPFQNIDQVQSWWTFRMLRTQRPLQERVALLWHNHFATGAGKVNNAMHSHRQIDLFRKRGLGSFRELVVAVGRDPAMLLWLDGHNSRKGKPNENYGRELMELFTLGVGNYTENDVQEVARAFTGWRADGEEAKFNPKNFDDGEKEILGQKGAWNDEQAVDIILSQPAAPRHIARRLLREFVHPHPTDEQVNHYAAELVAAKWEIKPVLRKMLASRLFFSEWAYRAKIKSPATLVIASLQAIGGVPNVQFVQQQMQRMGQALLLPPTVKGWDGEEAWINANTVMHRFNFGLTIASAQNNVFYERALTPASLKNQKLGTAEAIVDHYARVLMDGRLAAETRATLVDYMNRNEKNETAEFELNERTFNTKVRGLLHLMMATPEFQLA